MTFELLLLIALVIDALIGDPLWIPHPVRGIGGIAVLFEMFFRKIISHERIAGLATFALTLFISIGTVVFLLQVIYKVSPVLQTIVAVIILYVFIAVRDLIVHSREVYASLSHDLPISEARKAVGKIVGRDTADMTNEDICRACVETVAENMVDGITAPIFWAILLSLFSPIFSFHPIVLAAIGITGYKTINTMDSMFGYKNDRYLNFGWASAKIDDLVNYIPARLSGLCVVTSAYVFGKDGENSWKIFCRDRNNHASPNAAHTEAALAGALGLQLGGPSHYFGKMVDKPFIGDRLQEFSPSHILQTNKLIVVSSFVFIVIVCILRRLVIFFI